MGQVRNERVLELADAIHDRLSPDLLTPGERSSFRTHAAALIGKPDAAAGSHGAAADFGLDDLAPEAVQLAVIAAQAAIGVVMESTLRRVSRMVSRRKSSRTAPVESLSDKERGLVHDAVIKELTAIGVSTEMAEGFAEKVLDALEDRDTREVPA